MNKPSQHIQIPHDLGKTSSNTDDIKLLPTDYLVYGFLRKYMDKDTYQTFVSLRTISNDANIAINTVAASIDRLLKAGEIKLLSYKHGRSNIYEIQKSGRFFEMFTYEFLATQNLESDEKAVLMAVQQFSDKSDGQLAKITKTNEELSKEINIGTKALARVFRKLTDKGILSTDTTKSIDKVTGLKKTAKYVDLALICQAVLFVNQKVDKQGEQLEQHSEDIKNLKKELMRLKQENERLMKKITVEDTKFKFE